MRHEVIVVLPTEVAMAERSSASSNRFPILLTLRFGTIHESHIGDLLHVDLDADQLHGTVACELGGHNERSHDHSSADEGSVVPSTGDQLRQPVSFVDKSVDDRK